MFVPKRLPLTSETLRDAAARPCFSCRRLRLFWAAAALLHLLTPPVLTAAGVLDFVETLEGPPEIGDPRSLAVSPDGRHLYVTSLEDDVVAVFDAAATPLEQVATAPVEAAHSVVVSPDGRHVYVGTADDAIAVFRRDEASGALTFVETEIDGVDGVDGIGGPFEMTFSPDGRHLYVGGYFDDAVATFRRDEVTGKLSFVEAVFDSPELGLNAVSSIAISPDGRHLYVGGRWDRQVTKFVRDATTGKLTHPAMFFDGSFTPLEIAMSPDGRHVYMASSRGGAIYERDASTGAWTYLSSYGGHENDDSVLIGPDGRFVYGMSLSTSPIRAQLTVYGRDATSGQLSLLETRLEVYRGLPVLASPRDMAASPDGSRLFIVSDYFDALVVLDQEPSGALSLADVRIDGADGIDGLLGASSLAVSPDGHHVYATGFLSNALVVLERDPTSGRLSFVEAHVDGVGGVEGLHEAWEVTISPDGRHLYVVNINASVAVFERQAFSGRLSFVEAHLRPGRLGRPGLAVTPDGAHVYVDGMVFARDATDGTLSFVADVPELDDARSIVISGNGRHVYVADESLVRTFERDPATGLLTLLETPPPFDEVCYFEDGLGISTFCHPYSLAISPDGGYLYVGLLGDHGGGVMAFERDADTGSLHHFATYVEGEGYLFAALPPGIFSLSVAPDGRHLYAVSGFGDALVVFLRDRATGALAFDEIHYDDTAGIDGLEGPGEVAVSPDGRHVYVAAAVEDAVSVFEKNCVTGKDALCLNRERFQVDVEWRDFAGNTGSAQVVPVDSDDSGLFWFFAADNWEMLVKVLDGCGINDHFWVFAAATTNVEYTLRVLDLETGATKSYFNPLGNASAAITDTGALATCAEKARQRAPLIHVEAVPPPNPSTISKQGTCSLTPSALCLNDSRFRVEVEWRDFQGQTGSGRVVPVAFDDSGLFWFFAADNWEMLVKVLDGCGINDRFWVFSAATTNVEYTLRVTDTETGAVKEYKNPLGIAADAVTDTGAFATCP